MLQFRMSFDYTIIIQHADICLVEEPSKKNMLIFQFMYIN